MNGAQRLWRAGRPVDVRATLGPLRRGSVDPAFRVDESGAVWRTSWTPDGPGSVRIEARARDGEVVATAWGAGSGWLLASLPEALGVLDRPDGFAPPDVPALRDAWRRHTGWRVPRTGRVFEALAAAVIEQKVTGEEARNGWRQLLAWYGEPAPGPTPRSMRVPPPPEVWAAIPSWDFFRAGVTPHRSRTLVAVAKVASALERTIGAESAEVERVLTSVPGVGPWTAAETRQRAHGDADAVSVGDAHTAHDVCVALTGERGDDAQMLELLAAYRPHRYRVQRLVELAGVKAARRGPRQAPPPHRRG